MQEGQSVDYVMVPVPEELAPKVVRYISWKGDPHLRDVLEESGAQAEGEAAGGEPADDPLARVVARLDDQIRRLLADVAAASLDGVELGVPHVAGFTGMSERELAGVLIEVNNLVAGEGGPMITVLVKPREGEERDAPFSWDRRVVVMPEAVARSIAGLNVTPAGS